MEFIKSYENSRLPSITREGQQALAIHGKYPHDEVLCVWSRREEVRLSVEEIHSQLQAAAVLGEDGEHPHPRQMRY